MAPVYNDLIQRAIGSDALVPEPLSSLIIQELPKASAALSLMGKATMTAKTQRMPVLDVLPVAYFVGGDTGLKQTANQAWKNVSLVAEEVAVIIPVPEAYLADADVDIWAEVQPRVMEAAGALIDAAVFWGTNKPPTWGISVFDGASTAGNTVADGFLNGAATEAAADFGQSVAALGDVMAQTGYNMRGFSSRPGLNWRLMGMRSEQGMPIYQPDIAGGDPNMARLYGYPLAMVDNGSWNASKAELLAGDWSKAIIAIRQDMTLKLFTEGVVSDGNGVVVLNLMQQDSVALRLTMRLAYAVANPVTIMQPAETIDGAGDTVMRFPFGAITTAA